MSLLDDIKAKADANGDGKLTAADLESLKDGKNNDLLDQLKSKADANGDGKVDLADLGGLKDISSKLGDTLGGLKDKFLK